MKVKFSVLPLLALVMMALSIITPQAQAEEKAPAPSIMLDKTALNNGGEITVTGQVPAGAQVYVEVFAADNKVRANRFDGKKDPKTGKIPYKFYVTQEMPAFYKIFIPKDMQPELDKAKAEGKGWKYSEVLKKTGANYYVIGTCP